MQGKRLRGRKKVFVVLPPSGGLVLIGGGVQKNLEQSLGSFGV